MAFLRSFQTNENGPPGSTFRRSSRTSGRGNAATLTGKPWSAMTVVSAIDLLQRRNGQKTPPYRVSKAGPIRSRRVRITP
jgi:hypothetical protein